MPRRLRFVPDGGALVEVTCRTLQGRFLLRPSAEIRSLILGILGRSQRRYAVTLCGYVFLSNHYHLLLQVDNSRQLSLFMNYLNSNLAREVGRLIGWKEKFWGRRYQSIVVSDEEAAQVSRLRYLLSHGCKEGLVGRLQAWPGAHCVTALTSDFVAEGLWFDRTREYEARMRGEVFHRLKYSTVERVELAPLPCWCDLSEDEVRGRLVELIEHIEAASRVQHAREGKRPLGVSTILNQNSYDRPRRLKRVAAPRFHAATGAARRELVEAYSSFVQAYRSAAANLRKGIRSARFPAGSFPPPLPYVDVPSALAPG